MWKKKIVSSHPLSRKSIILIAFYPAPKEIKFSINSLKGTSKMGKKNNDLSLKIIIRVHSNFDVNR